MLRLGLAGYQPLVLYIGAIVAFLLSIVWKPRIGFYYLVPLLPMQTARYWLHAYPHGEKLVDVLLLGVLIGLFIHTERPIFASVRMNAILILFVALTYFSLWQGGFYLGGPLPLSYLDPRFSDWKNYVEMMLLFPIVAAAIRTPKQMMVLVALMCVSVLLVNRSYHSTISGRDFSQFSDDLRDAGPLGYAGENGMGAFQAEFAVFLIGIASFVKRRLLKIGIWLVAFTCIYCLVFSFSRGGYLGFLTGLFTLGVIKERKLLVVLLVILVAWQSLVPTAVTERVLMTYQDGQIESSAGERMTIWQDALQVISEAPVFGTGFDTYKFLGRVGPYNDTHNYYLKILLELGFVGLLLFLCVLGGAAEMSWRLFRRAKDPFLSSLGCAFLSMIVCAAVVNFFGDRWSYLQVNGFLWILLGCNARGLVMLKQKQEMFEMTPTEISVSSSPQPRTSHV